MLYRDSLGVVPHLLDAGAVIFLKSTIDLESGWLNLAQLLTIQIFGVGSHSRDDEDLLVFLDALLELAEQDSETWKA